MPSVLLNVKFVTDFNVSPLPNYQILRKNPSQTLYYRSFETKFHALLVPGHYFAKYHFIYKSAFSAYSFEKLGFCLSVSSVFWIQVHNMTALFWSFGINNVLLLKRWSKKWFSFYVFQITQQHGSWKRPQSNNRLIHAGGNFFTGTAFYGWWVVSFEAK